MAVSAAVLVEAKLAEDTATTQYTAIGTAVIIDKFTCTNVSSSIGSMTVNLVPSGAKAASSNRIAVSSSIAAGATYKFPELVGHILATGDMISTLASAPNALVLRISGRVIT